MNIKSILASWMIAILLLGLVSFLSQPSSQQAPIEASEASTQKEITYSNLQSAAATVIMMQG